MERVKIRVQCQWCGVRRGVLYIDTPNQGPWGVLFCPRCDWCHAEAAGPPPSVTIRIKDVDPKA